jgi:hypothetical protein
MTAPHASKAQWLIEQLKTNPGIVAILSSRELVVRTLGRMDPNDNRIMQRMQIEGGECLLGYSTNRGLRINTKLRTDDSIELFCIES